MFRLLKYRKYIAFDYTYVACITTLIASVLVVILGGFSTRILITAIALFLLGGFIIPQLYIWFIQERTK